MSAAADPVVIGEQRSARMTAKGRPAPQGNQRRTPEKRVSGGGQPIVNNPDDTAKVYNVPQQQPTPPPKPMGKPSWGFQPRPTKRRVTSPSHGTATDEETMIPEKLREAADPAEAQGISIADLTELCQWAKTDAEQKAKEEEEKPPPKGISKEGYSSTRTSSASSPRTIQSARSRSTRNGSARSRRSGTNQDQPLDAKKVARPPLRTTLVCTLRHSLTLRKAIEQNPEDYESAEHIIQLPPPVVAPPKDRHQPFSKTANRGERFHSGPPSLYPYRVLEWNVPEGHSVVPPLPPRPRTAVEKDEEHAAEAAARGELVDGQLYLIEPKHAPGLVVGCHGKGRSSGTKIALVRRDDSAYSQRWKVVVGTCPTTASSVEGEETTQKWYSFVAMHAPGQRLDNPGREQQCHLWDLDVREEDREAYRRQEKKEKQQQRARVAANTSSTLQGSAANRSSSPNSSLASPGVRQATPARGLEGCTESSAADVSNQLWKANFVTANSNQRWTVEDAGDGFVFLHKLNGGVVMDVAEASSAEGAVVYTWPDKHCGDNQKFRFIHCSTRFKQEPRHAPFASTSSPRRTQAVSEDSKKAVNQTPTSQENAETATGQRDTAAPCVANGIYTIEAKEAPGRVLSCAKGSNPPGASIILRDATGVQSQRWRVTSQRWIKRVRQAQGAKKARFDGGAEEENTSPFELVPVVEVDDDISDSEDDDEPNVKTPKKSSNSQSGSPHKAEVPPQPAARQGKKEREAGEQVLLYTFAPMHAPEERLNAGESMSQATLRYAFLDPANKRRQRRQRKACPDDSKRGIPNHQLFELVQVPKTRSNSNEDQNASLEPDFFVFRSAVNPSLVLDPAGLANGANIHLRKLPSSDEGKCTCSANQQFRFIKA